jgi:hypothetical protein
LLHAFKCTAIWFAALNASMDHDSANNYEYMTSS